MSSPLPIFPQTSELVFDLSAEAGGLFVSPLYSTQGFTTVDVGLATPTATDGGSGLIAEQVQLWTQPSGDVWHPVQPPADGATLGTPAGIIVPSAPYAGYFQNLGVGLLDLLWVIMALQDNTVSQASAVVNLGVANTELTWQFSDVAGHGIGGSTQNLFSIEYVDPGANNAPLSLSFDAALLRFTLSLATDNTGAITTTGNDAVSAFAGSFSGLPVLVNAANSGGSTGAGVLTATSAPVAFAGAVDGDSTWTSRLTLRLYG